MKLHPFTTQLLSQQKKTKLVQPVLLAFLLLVEHLKTETSMKYLSDIDVDSYLIDNDYRKFGYDNLDQIQSYIQELGNPDNRYWHEEFCNFIIERAAAPYMKLSEAKLNKLEAKWFLEDYMNLSEADLSTVEAAADMLPKTYTNQYLKYHLDGEKADMGTIGDAIGTLHNQVFK
jgi:hypothetical protein